MKSKYRCRPFYKLTVLIFQILSFPFYFMFTWKERDNYKEGMKVGKKVIGRIEYQWGTFYRFSDTEKPIREYQTFIQYIQNVNT